MVESLQSDDRMNRVMQALWEDNRRYKHVKVLPSEMIRGTSTWKF